MPAQPALHVVAAAIIRGGRVLAGRRPHGKKHGGKWELPGGKLELGENEEAAIVREIQEELLCTIRPVLRLGEHLHDGLRLCAWRCEILHGEPAVTEHLALTWLLPEELSGLDWVAADLPLLGLIFP